MGLDYFSVRIFGCHEIFRTEIFRKLQLNYQPTRAQMTPMQGGSLPTQIELLPLDIPRSSYYLWTFQRRLAILFAMTKGKAELNKKSEVLQGTLDLMILKTLHALGPLHGFGIACRLEQLSEEVLTLNEGTVYTSLLRLQQEGWIAAEWGASENNRKAKFHSITKKGLKQLARETEDWERISGVIHRLLRLEGGFAQ